MWPQILTIGWWRWCFAHGPVLAKARIRLYYIRNIPDQLHRPICWVIGHKNYRDTSWSYHRMQCARCRKITKRFR